MRKTACPLCQQIVENEEIGVWIDPTGKIHHLCKSCADKKIKGGVK